MAAQQNQNLFDDDFDSDLIAAAELETTLTSAQVSLKLEN